MPDSFWETSAPGCPDVVLGEIDNRGLATPINACDDPSHGMLELLEKMSELPVLEEIW